MAAKELHLGIRTRPFRRTTPVSPHVALRGVMPDSLAPQRAASTSNSAVGLCLNSHITIRCHGWRPVPTNSTGPWPQIAGHPLSLHEDIPRAMDAIRVATCTEFRSMRTSWFIPPTEWESLPPSPKAGGTIRAVRFGCTRTKRSPSFLEPASAVRIRASRRICRFPVAVGLRLSASFGG